MALTPRQMAVIRARARAKKAKPAAEMQRPTALGGFGYQPEEEASRQAFRQGAANVTVPSAGPQQPKAPTRLSAAAGQFAQSATLGQAPNILAAPYALTGQFPEAKAFYQQRLMQGAEKFPVTTGAADIAGFLAPGGAVLKGATTIARPVTRAVQTAPAIVRGGAKVVGGAGLGATEGALYGATVQAERQAMEQGQAAPTMQQRGEAAVPAAAMGAVVGGALPIVGKALAPVGTAIAGQAVKAFGPGATARQAERVAQKAVRADLQRAGINNLDDFLKAAEQYQGKPAMTGEIAQSTLNTLTALVRGKGTTGDKVQAILADRVAGFPARMMRDLEASTGLKADEILGDIDAMVKAGRETATPQYDIAKAAPFRVSEKLQSLIDRSPTVQQAVEAARGVIADKAAAAGKSVDEIPPLEFYDEVKQQIDRIEFSGRKMGDRETRQIDEVRRAFVQALDEIVPGAYAQARKAGGEAPKIREAVKLGQNSYTKPLEQVVSDIAGMGEPALKAYRGAFVTNLVNKIRMGQLKPAALRSPNLRDKMATLFGEDAADQLVTKFSQEFDLLKKGSRLDPNVGSVTSQALLGAPDQALDDLLNAGSAAVEFAQNLARGNLFGMGGQILNYFRRAGYTEAQLNAIGDLLASDPQRAARILFPNEMARLGATPGGAAATNVLANPTQPPSRGRNTLAMPPEVGGAFVGGALGATQGETPEERARNALLGAAGGAVGGRMARGMTPDKTRMGSNLGNVSKQEPPKTDLASTRIPQAALQDIGKIRQIVSETKEPLYIRWSRGPKQDLKPGARSKDYSAGTEEAGLSAVRIEPEWLRESDGYIARRLREYNSAFFDDASSMFSGHIYTGRKVGTDSDGYDVIVPSKHVFKISSEFQNWSRNADNVKIAELQEGIQRTNARLSDETLDPITRGVFERSKQQQTDELNKLVSAQSPTRMGSNLGNVPQPVQKAQAAGYEGADIGEAKEWVAARSKGLDMSQAARMERAAQQGFNVDMPLYHGTASNFAAFDKAKFGKITQAKSAKLGVWMSSSPETASGYAKLAGEDNPVSVLLEQAEAAGRKGKHDEAFRLNTKAENLEMKIIKENVGINSAVMPLFARGNFKTIDMQGARYAANDMKLSQLAEQAKREGFDGLHLQNFSDEGVNRYNPTDHVLVFKPSNIRSVNAAFDPASKESANILAGVGAVGAGAAMTGAIRPPEQKKPPGQRPRG